MGRIRGRGRGRGRRGDFKAAIMKEVNDVIRNEIVATIKTFTNEQKRRGRAKEARVQVQSNYSGKLLLNSVAKQYFVKKTFKITEQQHDQTNNSHRQPVD